MTPSHSGFRPNRSTSDVVWAHRWITAKTQCSPDLELKITGLDMSAAFDTIDRRELLTILKEILNDDEVRIIQYLLSETKLNVRIDGNNTERPFISNIGTPQGDSLSPVLFIVYLEHSLRDIRSRPEDTMPNEIIYADDIDFIGKTHSDIDQIERVLHQHNLKVNVNKTELTSLRRDSEEWKTSKKSGITPWK